MTSAEIRQSFLDFFREKKHTIVPSSPLLPDAPNLLFTNAGMNQFVPIFLAQQKPQWKPPRVADTQKCIRAGGKHNDLEDVGLDTYHHTFFEMLGNWSFGDYFKKEAIEWAWELLVERWKFPAQRLYATVYQPGSGEPSEFDQEAYDHWARLFREADLDPKVHVLSSGRADNFWMMGDTGPCGPCSEVHIDLTPDGDTRGTLVNKNDPRCIEIWNLVFIQFNANPDGAFTPLPQRHVDTGMGFERAVAIIQGTRNLTDFSGTTSNYETDVFRPIFDELEKLSGKKYVSTLPDVQGSTPGPGVAIGGSPIEKVAASRGDQHASGVRSPEQIQIDVAFRVIADHIRALSFAIADGINPSNEGRGYVLRRILRRAVRYGRTLGFHEPFFFKLVDVLAKTLGDMFPEIRTQQSKIKETIRREEEAFNKTLDEGIRMFDAAMIFNEEKVKAGLPPEKSISGEFAFKLYDTYGFPLDLTELMARERGLTVDVGGFERLMDEQRERARKAQKKEEIRVEQGALGVEPTKFLGYDFLETESVVDRVLPGKQTGRGEHCSRSDAVLRRDGRPSWRSRIASRSRTRLDRGRSVARDRYSKARRRFCSSRDGRGGSRARAGRGGAHLSGCRSAEIDSGTSHGHTFVALGIARSRLARCFAKRQLRRTRQIDVRFFQRAALAGAKARCGKTGERKNFRKHAGFLD